jgi:hypothetical protein
MFEGETDLVCRYHKDCPEGKVFLRKDIEDLDESWVDNPAKLKDEKIDAEKTIAKEPPTKPVAESVSDTDTVAEKLLKGEGLNFSSFIRAHSKDHKDQKVKKEMRGEYNEILEYYQDKFKGKIYKQGHDWFLRDK